MLPRLLLALALLAGGSRVARAEENTLSEKERQEGWQLLFDGHSTDGWMTASQKPAPASHVQNGTFNPHPCQEDYLLLYKEPVENFLLSLDFKVSPQCNSGVIFRISPLEPRPGRDVAFNGLEAAIDDRSPTGFHSTGAIYDLVAPRASAARPTGEWNHLELDCNRNRIKITLNGQTTAEMDTDEWPQPNLRPDGSMHKFDFAFKDHPRKGYLGLQDHGSDVWFRNIKLRRLD